MAITSLFSSSVMVETPYINITIGDYIFGVYDKSKGVIIPRGAKGKYALPNYVNSMNVTKVNGQINTYTISLTYAIQQGGDPNLIDKVLSSVSGTREIIISYGDYALPTYSFKNEKAMITKVTSQIDNTQSLITYNIICVSTALKLNGEKFYFEKRTNTRPSTIIIDELLSNEKYGLLDIFYGMRNKELLSTLIPTTDRPVTIEEKRDITAFDYLKYLVNCMSDVNDTNDSVKKVYKYTLVINDDTTDTYQGTYFKINRIAQNTNKFNAAEIYEVDVGYPSNSKVMGFSISDDQTYSILYNYANDTANTDYKFLIDDKGEVVPQFAPSISNSRELMKTTEADKTWWSQLTQFPIKATLTIRGLLKPIVLMSIIKINTLFYGKRHISSGYYTVTKEVDSISAQGYSTTLSLVRIGGDDEL